MDRNYYNYLVKRLDERSSKNPVIEETEKIIKKLSKKSDFINILDVGCFSGSLINRIYQDLPKNLKNKIRPVGLDVYEDALKKGVKNYPQITFIKGNLLDNLPLIKQYDIIIMSNVMHEVFSDTVRKTKDYLKAKKIITKLLNKTIGILNKKGFLVVLDGVMPVDPEKEIIITFKTKIIFDRFIRFSQKYQAKPILSDKLSQKTISTNIASLAAFLTKSRYLDKTYWKKESRELYQYFTIREFNRSLNQEKMKIIKVKQNKFSKKEIENKIVLIKPNIEVPAKNILIIAQKK